MTTGLPNLILLEIQVELWFGTVGSDTHQLAPGACRDKLVAGIRR